MDLQLEDDSAAKKNKSQVNYRIFRQQRLQGSLIFFSPPFHLGYEVGAHHTLSAVGPEALHTPLTHIRSDHFSQ